MSRVLVVPDMHAPFQHKQTIPFLKRAQEKFNLDRVICLGDEIDWHALSKFPKDPDGMSAGYELNEARIFLKEFYEAFPVVEVCTSNHTSRPFRKAFEVGIPEELILPYKQTLQAPDGWSWKDTVTVDGVDYIHGEGYSGENAHKKAAIRRGRSTVIGHIHSFGGVQYISRPHDQIFALNAGCLIDINAYCFKYAKKLDVKPTLGCGVVIDGELALFLPMLEYMNETA